VWDFLAGITLVAKFVAMPPIAEHHDTCYWQCSHVSNSAYNNSILLEGHTTLHSIAPTPPFVDLEVRGDGLMGPWRACFMTITANTVTIKYTYSMITIAALRPATSTTSSLISSVHQYVHSRSGGAAHGISGECTESST
jgi:hypothetical protein